MRLVGIRTTAWRILARWMSAGKAAGRSQLGARLFISNVPHEAWVSVRCQPWAFILTLGSISPHTTGKHAMQPKPHSPTEPEHPGSPSGDDVREPPVPSSEGKEDKFPRKGDLVDPEPASGTK
jgi:hypothetical protein